MPAAVSAAGPTKREKKPAIDQDRALFAAAQWVFRALA
jgi:hypothetical protein